MPNEWSVTAWTVQSRGVWHRFIAEYSVTGTEFRPIYTMLAKCLDCEHDFATVSRNEINAKASINRKHRAHLKEA